MKKIIKFQLFEGVEDIGRLSKEIATMLNTQIQNELSSSQIYRGMSCWLENEGWSNSATYFFKAAQEELTHMDKIYQYLFDRNVLALVPISAEVKQDYKDIRELVELALEHEISVTDNWEAISVIAKEQGDNTTCEFAQWFLKEQIEEENKFRSILDKMNLDIPKWKIDDLFNII